MHECEILTLLKKVDIIAINIVTVFESERMLPLFEDSENHLQ